MIHSDVALRIKSLFPGSYLKHANQLTEQIMRSVMARVSVSTLKNLAAGAIPPFKRLPITTVNYHPVWYDANSKFVNRNSRHMEVVEIGPSDP